MLPSYSSEEIEELNRLRWEKEVRDFKIFTEKVHAGICPLCELPLEVFAQDSPCVHWLLCPAGFKAKHFKLISDRFAMGQIQGFLRWYVNSFQPFTKINDLKSERNGDHIVAVTISHGVLEWSFSLDHGDLMGHGGKWPPHYHFQMRKSGYAIIKYGQIHIPLKEADIFYLKVIQGQVPGYAFSESYGAGMSALLEGEDISAEDLLNTVTSTQDASNASLLINSLIKSVDWSGIPGEKIEELLARSRETGESFAKLALENLEGVNVEVFIEPGEGVPDALERRVIRPQSKKEKD